MKLLVIIIVALSVTCATALLPQSQSASSIQSSSTHVGTIAGYVFDPDGTPLANAEVYAKILDDRPIVGRYPTSNTDKDGRFSIQNVWPGLNRIYASKEEDGYPDTSYHIYQTEKIAVPEVFVREGETVNGVILHLGRKCEKLAAVVVDAETRQPISFASVTLFWAKDARVNIASGTDKEGQFERLLPATPTKIRASAENYEQSEDLDTKTLMESVRGTSKRAVITLRHAE